MTTSLAWIENLTDSIWNWCLSVRDNQHPGYFYYCRSSKKIKPSSKIGLGFTSMALKIAYQINCLDRLSNDELQQWTEHICSFQRGLWGRLTGLFDDRAVMNSLKKWMLQDNYTFQVSKAETRQACAALLAAQARPRWPIRAIPHTEQQVVKYIDNLPWHLPWRAGSQATHLIFFWQLNAKLFNKTQEDLIPIVLAKFDEFQDKETGTWFRGNTSPEQKVNGAMKILTAYTLLGKGFAYPEKLIDFCLDMGNDQDACHNVDILYVLYQCNRLTRYRYSDIQDFAARRVEIIQTHYKPDGAFSFFPEHTGTHYYNQEVARPYVESDVHGTHLLVWGLTMAGELLGFNQSLGWRAPIT